MDRLIRFQYAALVAIVLGYVAHFKLLDARIQDDAFISFRYARHLAQGAGLVWNVGERVEGYSNFLWTLLLAIPPALSAAITPIQFARGLSTIAGYLSIVVVFLIVRHMAPRARLVHLVAPALLAGSWPFAINTMTGLETVFFGALVTIATWLLLREQDDLRYRGSSVVYALAALTRPEAIGLFLLTLGVVAFGIRTRGPSARTYLMRLGIPFALLVGVHEIFRLTYYGEFVPNTFFAKFGVDLPPGMPTRQSQLTDFLKKGMDPIGLSGLLAAFFMVATWRRDPRARIITIGALYGFANVALSGADFMIGFRFLVPYLPLLYVATALGLDFIADRIQSQKAANLFDASALALTAGACFLGYTHSRDVLRPFEQLRFRVIADSNGALGAWMARTLPPQTVVVARDIGELGYLSNLPIVDMTGLTDRTIARKPGNLLDREIDLDDLFGRNPGAFVFISKAPGPVQGPRRFAEYSSTASTKAILSDPRMDQFAFFARYPSYDRLAKGPNGSWHPALRGAANGPTIPNTYYLEVYLRKDLASSLQK